MRFLPLRASLLGAPVLAAALLLLGSATLQRPPAAYALTNCTVSDNTVDAQEQAFLGLINNYRAQNGKGALTMSVNLNRAATWLAVDMGAKNYFSHTDSLGRSPSTRAMNCGSPQGAGENIAAGTVKDTAQEAFDMWKASSGHNANMLNGSYKQIGIARAYTSTSTYKWYWVTDFSLTNDGTNALPGGGGSSPTATSVPPTATSVPPTATPTSPAAPTATPTQAPAQTFAKAVMTSPTPGSRFSSSRVTFNWSTGTNALEYHLYVGSSQGGTQYYSGSTGMNRSRQVSNLPRSRTIYVRLWTRGVSGWQYNDYTYRGR